MWNTQASENFLKLYILKNDKSKCPETSYCMFTFKWQKPSSGHCNYDGSKGGNQVTLSQSDKNKTSDMGDHRSLPVSNCVSTLFFNSGVKWFWKAQTNDVILLIGTSDHLEDLLETYDSFLSYHLETEHPWTTVLINLVLWVVNLTIWKKDLSAFLMLSNGFNCIPVIATLTCQSGSYLTLFASICVFLLTLKWLHQTHGLWKSCVQLRKQLSGHRC